MKSRRGYNPKRKIAPVDMPTPQERHELAGRIVYKGNPEHKRYPNDYGLVPPTNPRPGKTICDAEGAFPKAEAEMLLKSGMKRGMVSTQNRGGWPQNVWAVTETGKAFEAQLENSGQGHYHGYPMPEDDDFRLIVKQEWMVRGATC